MQLIFTIINRKGGVGKTSTVFNLAHFAAEQGLRTGVVDLDTQGSASRGLTGEFDIQHDYEAVSYTHLTLPTSDLV